MYCIIYFYALYLQCHSSKFKIELGMEKTFMVNISGTAFSIDERAYKMLSSYLGDIERRLLAQREDIEVLRDVESRIAELLKEMGINADMVINSSNIKQVIAIIGNPSVFGDEVEYDIKEKIINKVKSRGFVRTRNRVIGGVCGGIAKRYSLDLTLLRVLWVIAAFFFGASIWVYIILWIVFPEEKRSFDIDR